MHFLTLFHYLAQHLPWLLLELDEQLLEPAVVKAVRILGFKVKTKHHYRHRHHQMLIRFIFNKCFDVWI
jgi:hypothetical protein